MTGIPLDNVYHPPLKRREAKLLNEKHYGPTKPCLNGHLDKRRTSNGYCLTCEKIDHKLFSKQYRERHPDKEKASCKTFRENNREWCNNYNREYRRLHPECRRAPQAKRRAAKLNATPIWADFKKINQIYLECPIGYVVDHEIPLQGRNVCGLHVETNLKYLTHSDNSKKSNRFG